MHFLVIKKNYHWTGIKYVALTTFWIPGNTDIFDLIWLKFWFQTKFEKEIVCESSVLAWIRIRIEQKCWIRIKAIRIHNPGCNTYSTRMIINLSICHV
jgi:hypothetical protein